MPATSEKQRKAMLVAQHNPENLYARNKSLKSMTKKQLSEFTRTKSIRKK